MFKDHPHIAGVLIMLLGLGISAYGVNLRGRTDRFLSRAVRVPGSVLEAEYAAPGPHTQPAAWPIFLFKTVEGEELVVRSKDPTTMPGIQPGMRLPVLYDPEDPHGARLDTADLHGHTKPTFLVAGGVAVIAIGVAVILGIAG